LMVRSRGAAPIECDCPTDFFITPPVQIASRKLSRSRRAAFDWDPAQAAASRANGQHWLCPSVLGTPWRDHPPQQQRSANTRATFDENRLGRTSRPGAKDAQHINRLQQQCVPPCPAQRARAPLSLGYELAGDSFMSTSVSQPCGPPLVGRPRHHAPFHAIRAVAPRFVTNPFTSGAHPRSLDG
jgi:hypothetical protein